ncbi:uncharacterized protein VTP21DRAFT_7059 [Calcarisporiella thermophila]|uniref:uncharacterized protein n=1 Tax=Calcarisporiella thermophila TaxID=911321 RepID=UPI0037445198
MSQQWSNTILEKGHPSINIIIDEPYRQYNLYDPNGLPTLHDVLLRRTRTPLCLYSFRLFLQHYHADNHAHELMFLLHIRELEQIFRMFRKKRPSYNSTTNLSVGAEDIFGLGVSMDTQPLTLHTPQLEEEGVEDDDYGLWRVMERKPSTVESLYNFLSPTGMLTSKQIRGCAERLYQLYLAPHAECNLSFLPGWMRHLAYERIQNADLEDIEASFQEIKRKVYDHLERDGYPRFIARQTRSNLTPLHALIRGGVGLFALFCAFTVEFSLIFLDIHPRTTRFWCLIPFWIGTYNIAASYTELCPLTVIILRLSETQLFHFVRIQDPSAERLLSKRARRWWLISALPALLLTLLFFAIPGKRL